MRPDGVHGVCLLALRSRRCQLTACGSACYVYSLQSLGRSDGLLSPLFADECAGIQDEFVSTFDAARDLNELVALDYAKVTSRSSIAPPGFRIATWSLPA